MSDLSPRIRILIADDHAMILDGMISIIQSDPLCQVVARALNGEQAIKMFQKHQPDITILDLKMPKMDGLRTIKAIRELQSDAKIIVLSAHDGDEMIYQALQAGAMSYVLKEMLYDELNETIKSVQAGKKRISPEIAAKFMERASRPALSEREIEILTLIVQGMANNEIATALFITEGTVKVHVHTIFNKLKVSDRTAAAMAAIRHGIVRL